MGDGVSINRVPKNVKVNNNSMSNGIGNQDNWGIMVEDIEDFDNCVTIAIDLAMVNTIDGIFVDNLAYLFSPSSHQSNSLPNITTTYDSKFKFLFTFLLILL